MSNIDKQALREEFRYMQDHYSDPADRARQVIYIAAEALLDELDKKQQYIKLRDQENEDIALTVGKLRVELEHYKSREERVTKLVLDNSTSWDVLYEKLEAAERRIAELEARAVNLPKRSVDGVMHLSGFIRDYAEGWCAGNDNAIHEIRAAGIKVKES
ncbi:ead/Ea22-like family protein [Salmonella enterica]|nr:ead/Ea22-like family protein [Salmonella enterica]EKL8239156.1 ead/Ea22-like family protein [Salmonella enterica]